MSKVAHTREGNAVDNRKAVALTMAMLRGDKREGILGGWI